MLEARDLATSYGSSQVLFGVSLDVGGGEVVSLLGRNGMGKTTTVRSIMGLTRPWRGSVRLRGREITGLPAYRIARLGVGLVPEGRQIFPNLTVAENLVATARRRAGATPWTLERVYGMFPALAERAGHAGNHLSGGEQQMLAIGRALLTNPELLILDEATEGLAPAVRGEIWRCLARLKDEGQSILIVDSNLRALLRLCDRHHVIEKGRIVWSGSSAELADAGEVRARHLGV
ncbi:MAG TPA: ABC transporter ATP-binding protein [Geminicoccaceae bacterium]|nr:ABC transporter ATP-binding protein [Geminicoccaceae bacterium]